MDAYPTQHIAIVGMGPKIAYQCDCACPRSTPTVFSKEKDEKKLIESPQYRDQLVTITINE